MCSRPAWTGFGGGRPRGIQAVLARPDAAVLDICCGTGDMTRALLRRRPKGARPILAAILRARCWREGAAIGKQPTEGMAGMPTEARQIAGRDVAPEGKCGEPYAIH